MDLWVVGAGGLLGSAVTRGRPASSRLFRPDAVPWHSPAATDAALAAALDGFVRQRDRSQPWAIVWAAGTGVVSSDPAALAAQEQTLLTFASRVADLLDPDGAFLFASSASVFGNADREFDERDTARPVGPYATAKLRQEDDLRDVFAGTGTPVLVVARISTLYGVGQNLAKRQGLVSSMCLEAVRGGVITLYVPMDTTRDYLFADDAATLCFLLVGQATRSQDREPLVRVLASHRTTTIGELARLVQAVVHRRVHIMQADNGTAVHLRRQAVRSMDPALAAVPRTPLVVGVDAVHKDVLGRVMQATHRADRPA